MKYIRGKFQKNISFVKPLYRKVYPNKTLTEKNDNVSEIAKLDGQDTFVKRINNTDDKSAFRTKERRKVRSRHSYTNLKRVHTDDGGHRILWENVDVKDRSTCFGNTANSMLGLINANQNEDRSGQHRSDITNTFRVS